MSQRTVEENPLSTGVNFYAGKASTVGSDYIYDETYKSYKIKQKFEKDPKYSYFNAVMQMKHKLSSKEQVYKKVFEAKENQQQSSKDFEGRKTFYSRTNQSMIELEPEIIKVEKLKRNSFRIVKEQSVLESLAIMKKNKSQTEVISMNRTNAIPRRSGHRSSMSLSQKHNPTHFGFEMTTKARNNKSYVEFEVTQRPAQIQANQTFYQPLNPKPRLEEIMQEYRKMNHHSHYPKSKKSTLPKQFVEKLYQTNKMFYSSAGKKRVSLY